MTKILIRCDSSILIGSGHLTRCLNLAISLREYGFELSFACRYLEGNLIKLLEEKQFKVIALKAPESTISGSIYDKWRGVSLESEISEFSAICHQYQPEWVIVDHYGLSIEWEKCVKGLGIKLFVIDDIFRTHYCDALLDQNFHLEHESKLNLENKDTVKFLGPRYTLLSDQFRTTPIPHRTFENVENVLVFFGGTDPDGETLNFLNSIMGKTNYKFQIVVGQSNPHIPEIKVLCSKDSNFYLHVQISNMAELMVRSDIFIGAGGSTTWERCFLGLPAICVTIAENQVEISNSLQEAGIHVYLGKSGEISKEIYIESLNSLSKNSELQKQFSHNSLALGVGSLTNHIYDLFKGVF